jgi:hypothetical protein
VIVFTPSSIGEVGDTAKNAFCRVTAKRPMRRSATSAWCGEAVARNPPMEGQCAAGRNLRPSGRGDVNFQLDCRHV